ncbi:MULTISPECIES: polysaccharide biosynthesis tyrosine autokinase [Aeromicrobium]|uniref:polysaccharide biosynthesis tyrosine autokinase n=1 Tax=Aeromicrobium TaxID=2040 RepID=UPI000B2FE224|nr:MULTISPECIES: polysaccharide biosynthesis tyrosine autokinase [Aeromicrobium]MCL8253130.1 polysaccharide biosynthesis tyrosine autokinase [Aeromicrobium fastidiosum]
MDLRQFLGILRSRWVFSVSTFVVGAVATILLVLSMSPVYGSSAKLFITSPVGQQVTDPTAAYFASQRLASYADLAREPSLLQDVINRLNLTGVTREELAGQVTAQIIATTQTLQVDVTADSAELAQQIAEAEAEGIVSLVARLEKPTSGNGSPAFVARIVGPPSISQTPVAPNVPLNIAVGLLLSLFVAIAGAVLRDLLDRTVKTRQEAEELSGGAVLATLPFDRQLKKQALTSEGHGALAEAFRVLRTNLQFANLDAKVESILVSSAVPNEGKTLVATNLAMSMAQSGRSVLLIDADMRNPNVADLLGLENSVGLMTVLIGRTSLDEATQVHDSGISFLGTGPKPPNPAEVLDTQAMRDLLHGLRSEYDVVVIDAPPMLPVADASILMREVDGALMLVRHGSTTREQLRLAVARIETVGGKLFGTILNRTPRRAGDVYGYGYGYGYGQEQHEPIGEQARRMVGALGRGESRSSSGRRVSR